MISTEKQAELLQRSDISKIFLRNGEKSGAAHAAPPIPYGYSIVRICSIRDCFFMERFKINSNSISITISTTKNILYSLNGKMYCSTAPVILKVFAARITDRDTN